MYTIHEGCTSLSSGNTRASEYDVPNKQSRDIGGNLAPERPVGEISGTVFKHDFSSCYSEHRYIQFGAEVGEQSRSRGERLSRSGSMMVPLNTGQSRASGGLKGSGFDYGRSLEGEDGQAGTAKLETSRFLGSGEITRGSIEHEKRLEEKSAKLSSKPLVQSSLNNICRDTNLGGFRDPDWYKRIPNWERIIDERYTSVYSSYERLEMIGTGTYAKVWLLRDKITGKKYAGKLLEPQTYPLDTIDRIERMFQSEIKNLIISQCPGVVRLHKIVVGPEGSLLVQDYVDDGTIWRENCCVSELEAFQHFIQLIQSVLYFQDKGVVHRDLKPTNILRYSNKTIVIGDFGWSEQTKKLHLNPSEWPGTLEINPPEVLTFKGPLTEKIDNYAVGMNLLLFLTGRFICRQKGLDVTEAAPYILKVVELIRSDFNNKILNKGRQKSGSQMRQSQYFMWEIFIGFTDPNPNTRWSIKKALFHPDCIQQLIYCFHSNFPLLWHPQVIAIIKSNIIPGNVSQNQSHLEDGKQYGEVIKQGVSTVRKGGSRFSQATNTSTVLHNANLGDLSCAQNPIIGDSELQKNYYKHAGTSLRPANFLRNQVNHRSNSIQQKVAVGQFLPGSSDNSSLFNEPVTSLRSQSAVSSSGALIYTNNQKFSGLDHSFTKQSQFVNNFHY
ncbi:putative serine/threonine protein kinase [Cryptosporidium felis]|nr:putative serine/threonine protein kinase [Cryptosporidium felis]